MEEIVMKKGWLKKLICAGLALTMAVSLPACGKKKDTNSALAKEHVYKYEELALPDLGKDINIMAMLRKDDLVYMLVRVYHWDDEKFNNSDTDVRLISMNDDEIGRASCRERV